MQSTESKIARQHKRYHGSAGKFFGAAAVLYAAGLTLMPSLAPAAPAAPGKLGRLQPPPSTISRVNLEAAAMLLESGGFGYKAQSGDTLRFVALRVEFPNLAMGESPPPELHDRFWFQTQFQYVQEYFEAASLGSAAVVVEVPDLVAMALQDQEYYGNFALYDSLMLELLAEVIPQFDSIVNFSEFAGVILLHAGPGQESDLKGDSPLQIWSGYLDPQSVEEELSTPDSLVSGIPADGGAHLVTDLVILPEWEVQDLLNPTDTRLGHLGVYVHELGNKLGMLPLFDPDPSPIPDSQGIGNFGVMGYGLWVANGFIPALPGLFNRTLMGWVTPRDSASDGELVVRDYERGPADSVVVRVPISGREYFLVSYIVEDPDGPMWWVCNGDTIGFQHVFNFDDKNNNCRFDYEDTNGDGIMSPGDLIDSFAGAEWDFFMTDLLGLNTAGFGYGLLVLHVDEQRIVEVLRHGRSNVQTDPRRKGVDVEEADGIEDLDRGADNARSFGSFEDYWFLNQEFGPDSIPSTASANGTPTGIRITLVDLPDSTATIPGGRARLRVQRGTTPPDFETPKRVSARLMQGWHGTELVSLPLADGREAIVVPGDSGRVFLMDVALDEAPISDGDPATMLPWLTVPAPWAGRWSAPAVVGDLDGDGVSELILVAEADSVDGPVTRVFAWRQDGSEFVDLDDNPATQTGLLASVPGGTERLLLFDLHDDPGLEIVVATRDSMATVLYVWPQALPCPPPSITSAPSRFVLPAGQRLAGGPIGIIGPRGTCSAAPGLAWVTIDPLSNQLTFQSGAVLNCCGGPPVSTLVLESAATDSSRTMLLATDLDGDGSATSPRPEVVVVHSDGRIEVLANPTDPERIVRRSRNNIADNTQAPLAVADIDDNGTLEILISGERGFHVLSMSGAELPGWPYRYSVDAALAEHDAPGQAAATPLVADLDADGSPEILAPLQGGALLVWDRSGRRRKSLETTLPAWKAVSPLFLPTQNGPRLVGLAQYERVLGFTGARDSLQTSQRTELAVWDWPQLRSADVIWGQWGGDATGAFHLVFERDVSTSANDASLASFRLGPNPASTELRTRLQLTGAARVSCTLFNIEGEIVQRQDRQGVAGELVEFVFDLRQMASSPYLARMQLSTGGQRVMPFVVRR